MNAVARKLHAKCSCRLVNVYGCDTGRVDSCGVREIMNMCEICEIKGFKFFEGARNADKVYEIDKESSANVYGYDTRCGDACGAGEIMNMCEIEIFNASEQLEILSKGSKLIKRGVTNVFGCETKRVDACGVHEMRVCTK